MMKLRLTILIVGLLALSMLPLGIFAPASAAAQGNRPNNCPQLVRLAEEELALNCANLPFNTACYGYPDVLARLEDNPNHAVDRDFVPGAWTGLETYASLAAIRMSVPNGVWGLAALNVQADIPRGLAEELPTDPGVLFLLFGGIEVENAVPQGLLYAPVEKPLPIVTATEAEVKDYADAGANTLGTVLADTTLFADGISPDGEWVRVAFEMWPGWVPLASLAAVDVSGLPEIGPDSLTPMQSFYLRNGFDTAQCNQAVPSVLLLQVPADVVGNVMVNGLPVRLDSATVVVRILPGDLLKFQVISGLIVLNPDTPAQVIIPAGFSHATCELAAPDLVEGWDDEPNDQVVRPCPATAPVPFSNPERQELLSLERLSDGQFFYEFRIPRVTRASGVGGPIDKIEIPPDSPAYDRILLNCQLGRIPAEVCQHLIGWTLSE